MLYTNEKLVLLAGFTVRLLLSIGFSGLQSSLDNSVEFSTPFTSFKSLQEGIFLLNNGFPLYSGGVVHQSPLLVYFIAFFNSNLAISVLYALIDSIIAYQLLAISKCFRNFQSKSTWYIALLYLFNPLVLLSNISRSSILFSNVAISTALLYSLKGNYLITGVSIAISGYLSLYPLLLVIPLLGILRSNTSRINLLSTVVVTLAILLAVSFNTSGNNWDFIKLNYIALLNFEKLSPNLGLWWYFFIEMFDVFIPFYHSVFNLFVVSFVTPFTIRFYKQPLYAFILSIGWITLTKPYPTLGDCGFFLGFIPFFSPIFGYMKYSAFTTLLFLHAMVLSPIFYHLWVDLGSANSNFFYAISLVYALAIASLIVDLIWAMLRMEYDKGKPDFKSKLTQL
ncbi:hypothetical protein Kpol_1050p108 [Vanderwaltozyma polyspora DSM 70294]|uniref:GPI transamidase component GAB1 n=1 Tax=Vanderwaltozyma polyspora (strain ATCC 22028 / DSM 70294 / BCRC 21397 / CBS 2163 / NBRC 10782 / NRRL Y-8283 / UCD 57-17) TaxID=436907 RepID=A7TF02_VANPO|nr:uncharacterized protein Kpol_1050p108 [Vanderwaltozyma polyspora DSM 70294]EDO19248.1 hypothetical protein Kpol_1050p108 [Vanderwaltozyma polyspora DSM 70294]